MSSQLGRGSSLAGGVLLILLGCSRPAERPERLSDKTTSLPSRVPAAGGRHHDVRGNPVSRVFLGELPPLRALGIGHERDLRRFPWHWLDLTDPEHPVLTSDPARH